MERSRNPTSRWVRLVSMLILAAFGSALTAGDWRPQPGLTWQIQLSGPVKVLPGIELYDIDLFEVPDSKMRRLRTAGARILCYFNAGAYEQWRSDAALYPPELLGAGLDGWPGERWLDIRRIELLAPILRARLDLAQARGCDGVDPDNVDGYANRSGFPLSAGDQLTFNRWLAREAHARGLAVGLKNDLDQIEALAADFDLAVNEQCVEYRECDRLLPFVRAGKPVLGIEYRGPRRPVCRAANARGFDTLIKRRQLDAFRRPCAPRSYRLSKLWRCTCFMDWQVQPVGVQRLQVSGLQ